MKIHNLPWTINRIGSLVDCNNKIVIITGVSLPLASSVERSIEAKDNMKLLSIAPDMYQALQEIKKLHNEGWYGKDELLDAFDKCEQIVDNILGRIGEL